MSIGSQGRKRSERVAQLELPPGQMARLLAVLRHGDVVLRLSICVAAAFLTWAVTGAWWPLFPYRVHQTPNRDIIARVTFEIPDKVKTAEERAKARRSIEAVYDHDPQHLSGLRELLRGKIFRIVDAESYAELEPGLWDEFQTAAELDAVVREPAGAGQPPIAFSELRQALVDDEGLIEFGAKLEEAFAELNRCGLIELELAHDPETAIQTRITVRNPVSGVLQTGVQVELVRVTDVAFRLESRLKELFDSDVVAERLFVWIEPRLPTTLLFNPVATSELADKAAADVPELTMRYEAGKHKLASAGTPLTTEQVALLRQEHTAAVGQMSWLTCLARTVSLMGMYIALYILCGVYFFYRHPHLLWDLRQFALLQGLIVVTVTLARLCTDPWQAELIPLLLFGMVVAITYRHEVALLLSAVISLVIVLSLGQGLVEYVIAAASLAATILLLRHIRSRTKLIYVGLSAGAVALLTTLGVGIVADRAIGWPLLLSAGWHGLFGVVAGLVMTGLLPFVESIFDVQTEISLLELGDVAHPLLQELVRRAPGTYNHSINVASIGEAAAEAIGANGLLVRVGAYFHDIGKMLKPQYFVENQGTEANRHETLLPAMSTLIIIAHVKDGADLARQHHLPQPIIDFVLQHHGTTLVEYFFRRASQQSEEDPDASEVDEGSFRYPGPKPQTREAAVLMLADAVESASRSLQEPAPARIESLVHDIALKRLLDGQFDECGLTLQQLRTVEDSLVKSLAAVYHGRVKYPDQQTA